MEGRGRRSKERRRLGRMVSKGGGEGVKKEGDGGESERRLDRN